jgi:asparagine synthetase B (glutamine-hydrolysing)
VLKQQVPRWFEAEFAKRVKLDGWMLTGETHKFPTLCQEKTYRALTRPAIALALNQMDGMASAFSLESRHPYLDRRLIEFFLSIPSPVKMTAGYRKQFAQRAMVGIAPGPIRENEGIEYFVSPMDHEACARLEAERMERDLFHPRARVFRYVRRPEAARMLERYVRHRAPYRNLLWSFARLELWLRRWFPELSVPEGGTS